MRRVPAIASGAPRAISAASASAVALTSAAGTTRSTRPQPRARSAETGCAVRKSSRVRDSPIRATKRCRPRGAYTIPSRTGGMVSVTSGCATRRSQVAASSQPPPIALPLSAAITGSSPSAIAASARSSGFSVSVPTASGSALRS